MEDICAEDCASALCPSTSSPQRLVELDRVWETEAGRRRRCCLRSPHVGGGSAREVG